MAARLGLPSAARGLPGRAIWAVCHCAGGYATQTSPSSSDEPTFYWDDPRGGAGLPAGAEPLRAVDQPDATAQAKAERFAAAIWEDVERSLDLTAERPGTIAIPAGPRLRIDPGATGSLVSCGPLDPGPGRSPGRGHGRGQSVAIHPRVGPRLLPGDQPHRSWHLPGVLQLAAVELRAGDRALDRLAWMLDAATHTWTWPDAIHPRPDGVAWATGTTAGRLPSYSRSVRDLRVREVTGSAGAAGP